VALTKEKEGLEKLLRDYDQKSQTLTGKINDWKHPLQYDTELGAEGSSPGIPVIQGPFTNWHPKRMLPIEDFCVRIDNSRPDFLDKMRQEGSCSKEAESTKDLNERER